jgi:hypothetical protein
VQGQTLIKRYFCYIPFSCVSLDRFERKSVSTLRIFCLRVRVKLFEAIYLSAGRFSYNRRKGQGWRVQISLDIGGLYLPLGGLSLPLHLEDVSTFGSHYFP